MKAKIKLLLAGVLVGVSIAARPYDCITLGLIGLAALIGVDAWFQLEPRRKTYAEWRAEELRKPLP